MEFWSKLSNQMNEILIVNPTEHYVIDSDLQVLDVKEPKNPIGGLLHSRCRSSKPSASRSKAHMPNGGGQSNADSEFSRALWSAKTDRVGRKHSSRVGRGGGSAGESRQLYPYPPHRV